MANKVLLANDEEDILMPVSATLGGDDRYSLILARDGAEVLKKAHEELPDLIFLDVMMPKINGFEVTRHIKADPTLRATKIVLLTAKGQDADRQTGEDAGADAYMTKPFSPTKILERARALLSV